MSESKNSEVDTVAKGSGSICALAGAFGILSGFGLFVLLWRAETGLWAFLVILAVVALFASGFEHIRDVIEGHERDFSFSRAVTGLFLVAMFELFIMALHSSFTAVLSDDPKDRLEIGWAILGPKLAADSGPVTNLICMAGLWIFLGAVLGLALTVAMDTQEKSKADPAAKKVNPDGAIIGLMMGVVGAPVVVLFYVVCARIFAEIKLMLFDPDRWTTDLKGLYDNINWGIFAWPFKAVIWLSWQVARRFHSATGPILATGALVAVTAFLFAAVEKKDRNWIFYSAVLAPVAVFGLPLIGTHVLDDAWSLGKLLLLVAVLWGVPGLLLGIAVPYLRKPSENPKVWAIVAWISACVLLLFVTTIQVKWILLFGALLGFVGLAFWRGMPLEEYWPLIALCVATLILGATKITLGATFLHVQDLSNVLVSEPPLEFSPKEAVTEFSAIDLTHPLPFAGLSKRDWKDNLFIWPTQKPKPKPMAEWLGEFKTEDRAVNALLSKILKTIEMVNARMKDDKALQDRAGELTAKNIGEVRKAGKANQDLLGTCQDELGKISLEQEALTQLGDGEPPIVETTFAPSIKQYITKLQGEIAKQEKELNEGFGHLQTADKELQVTLTGLNKRLAEQFELCMNGSIGFWIPLGLLAAWSRHRRIRHGDT
jgi:hypothetical protein